MPLPNDDHRQTRAPFHPAARPSLTIDVAAVPRAANGDARSLRMLDELESVVTPGTHRSTPSASRWTLLVALCALTLAALWAWSHQRAANPSPSIAGTAEHVLDAAPIAKLPQLAASSNSAPIVATVARIETLPEESRTQAGSSTGLIEPVAAPATPAAPRPASPAAQTAEAPSAAMPTRQPTSDASTRVLAKRAKEPAPVARSSPVSANAGSTARARPRSRDLASSPRPAIGGPDADVLLLSALLDHVSNEGRAMLPASSRQVTLAQVVRRCEARSGRSAAQARECRQRICEGYWGKAEACPMRLAPEKKS